MNDFINFDPMAWSEQPGQPQNNSGATPVINNEPALAEVTDAATEHDKIMAVGQALLDMGANIAESYFDWLRLGFALADGLGAEGRDLYHQLSAQSTKYNEAQCERKWQNCLRTNNGRTTVKTFYYMAQQAGVDLEEIGRRFPSNPQFPQPEGEELKYLFKGVSNDSSSFPQVEGIEGMRESQAEQAQLGLPTFSDILCIDDLPPLLRDVADTQASAEAKDMMLLVTLCCLSGVTPGVYGVYDNRRVYAPFYGIFSAPAAADKGQLSACRQLLIPIQHELDAINQQAEDQYQQDMATYMAEDKKTRASTPIPQEPPYRSVFIPANSSATATCQALSDNQGWGVIFETEADTMTQTLKQDYGDYSDVLRKAFHHEHVSYNRRKEHERVSIDKPRLAVVLTCTPGQIPLLLPSCENGLGSRFIFYNLSRRLFWRNVFNRQQQTLDDTMLELGERYYRLYQELRQRECQPIEFLLSQEQQAEFNQFFEGLQLEQVGLHGDDLIAFVRRLGLVCFRIAMLLTVLRHETMQPLFDPLSQSLVCSDVDFHTAMTIANCLINHTAHVYANLVPHTEQPKHGSGSMSVTERRVFDSLSASFTTDDAKQVAAKLAIPWKTVEHYLGNFISRYHIAVRIQNGKYKKS